MQAPLNTDDSIGQTTFYQMADYPQTLNQTSCLDILGTQVGILIQQRFEFFQVMIGFQTPNVFKVYAANDQGEQIEQKELFKCKEKSSPCARKIYRPSARPFEMFVSNYGCKDFQADMDQLFQENSDRIVFKFDRKYLCTCCCFNRPRLDVYYVENGQNKNLGYIVNPTYCCTLGCHIYDFEDNLKYIIEGSLCQCYFWCSKCPCSDQCNHVDFDIKTPNREVVANIRKKVKVCCQNWADFNDNISVVFPQNASKEDKALILAGTILFDYMYCCLHQQYSFLNYIQKLILTIF